MSMFADIFKIGIVGLKNTFNFRGYISKSDFEKFALFYCLYSGLVFYYVLDFITNIDSLSSLIVLLIVFIFVYLTIISCSVRRLRDSGQSGWKALFFLPLGFVTYAMYTFFLIFLNSGIQIVLSDINLIFQEPDSSGLTTPNLFFTIIGQIFYLVPMLFIRSGEEQYNANFGGMGSIKFFLLILSTWLPMLLLIYGIYSAIFENFKSGFLWGLLSALFFPFAFLFPIFLEGNWVPFSLVISSLILRFILPVLIGPFIFSGLDNDETVDVEED